MTHVATKNLAWLVSFPKSGNTWMRILLAGYDAGVGQEVDVNHIDVSLHSGGRELFDRVIGLEASDLTAAEIDRYRPDVYRQLAIERNNDKPPLFIKVHDCMRANVDGEPIFPPDATRVAVYIIRNPLGVVPSYANHYNISIDAAIDELANTNLQLAAPGNRLKSQLHQPISDWSRHVCSWIDQKIMPVHVVRYEDMHTDPCPTFSGVLAAAGMPVDPERVAWAVDQSQFDRLQAQETQTGFKERGPGTLRFFRKGKPDSWREELTSDQIQRVVDAHGEVMAQFDYLP